MKLIKKTESNIPFSLHDSRIMKLEICGDNLVFQLDEVFEYTKETEKHYPACMVFEDIDAEECGVLVFSNCNENENFAGMRYGINEYVDCFADTEFEILTENYGSYTTVFEGWIWKDGMEPVSGIIKIWNSGNIVFLLE